MKCFFCDNLRIGLMAENNGFIAKYDENPVTDGHVIIVAKEHLESFFDLDKKKIDSLIEILHRVKEIIDKKYHPNGYNIGVNDGKAAGRTIDHLHIHLIPRYFGDVKNPRGGVRNVIPSRGDYLKKGYKQLTK